MASSSVLLHRPRIAFSSRTNQTVGKCGKGRISFVGIGTRRLPVVLSMTATADSGEEIVKSVLPGNDISIMVNLII